MRQKFLEDASSTTNLAATSTLFFGPVVHCGIPNTFVMSDKISQRVPLGTEKQ